MILILAGAYAAFVLYVATGIRPSWGKTIAVVVIALIPAGEAIYGRFKLHQLCEAGGGIKIYKTAANVEGLFSQSRAEPLVAEHGFRFAERIEDGKLVRLSKGGDGSIVRQKIGRRASEYEHVFSERAADYMMMEHTNVVRESASGQVLGSHTDFQYYGSRLSQELDRVLDQKIRRAHCQPGNIDDGDIRLIKKVLMVPK